MFVLNSQVYAGEPGVELMGVKAHAAIERSHACLVVKTDSSVLSDCNDPKCMSGGAAVDAALAVKGEKRICKTIDASVNRGYDVTYSVNGKKYVAWTARDPEPELNKIGLTVFEEHSPLNPACALMSFKEASAISECSQMKQ